jgi:hypothetical protein
LPAATDRSFGVIFKSPPSKAGFSNGAIALRPAASHTRSASSRDRWLLVSSHIDRFELERELSFSFSLSGFYESALGVVSNVLVEDKRKLQLIVVLIAVTMLGAVSAQSMVMAFCATRTVSRHTRDAAS